MEPKISWWLGGLLLLPSHFKSSPLNISPNCTAFPIRALSTHTKSLISAGFKNTFLVIICFPSIWNHWIFHYYSTKSALQYWDKVNLTMLCFFLLTITFKSLVFRLSFLNWCMIFFSCISSSFLVLRKHQCCRIGSTVLEYASPGLWCSWYYTEELGYALWCFFLECFSWQNLNYWFNYYWTLLFVNSISAGLPSQGKE